MINLSKVITLEKINIALTTVKNYVDAQISALAQSVSGIMGDVNSSLEALEADMVTKGNCEILIFRNKEIPVSDWIEDTTNSLYPYRAAISCDGVTVDHIPDVYLSDADANSLNFAPTSETAEGVIYISAKEIPTTSIIVPIIEFRRAVS